MDREQRLKKYSTASDEIRELYGSIELGGKMLELFETAGIAQAKYDEFAHSIGDVILGFYPISELSSLFVSRVGVSDELARKMSAELVELLSPVLEKSTIVETKNLETTSSFIPIQGTRDPTSQPSVSEKNDALQSGETPSVEPVRTMQEDMDRIHGYGAYRKLYPDNDQAAEASSVPPSTTAGNEDEQIIHATSQDDVLKRPPLAETPSYTEPKE